MPILKYTDQELAEAVKSSFSIREVLSKLGVIGAGGNYKTFHTRVKRAQIDTSHFTGQGHLKNKECHWHAKLPLNQILVKNSSYASHALKLRLLKEKVLENKCIECGISQWRGEELSLHLDHIDGDNTNNELSNLRLLCPNCHSLTPTYCGKNKKSHLNKSTYYCTICGKQLSQKRETGMCLLCCRVYGRQGGT